MFMRNQIYLITLIRTKTGSAFNTTTRTCKQAGTAKSESHSVGTSVLGSLACFKETRGSRISEQKHVSLGLQAAGFKQSWVFRCCAPQLLERSGAAEGNTGLSVCPSCGWKKDCCPSADSHVSFLWNLVCITQIFVTMSLPFKVDGTGHWWTTRYYIKHEETQFLIHLPESVRSRK